MEWLFHVVWHNTKQYVMKKLTILLSAVFLAFQFTGNAQSGEDTREELHIGLKAGTNLSNVWDEHDQDFEANDKWGFAGGVFVQIPIGKYLGIQPELLYSQKGFQGSGVFLGQSYAFNRTTNYLDVPVLFTFKPSPYFALVGGPQYSFLMSQQDVFTSGPYSSSEFRQYENDNIRKNTLGLVLGFDVTVDHFIFSPRAGWDLQTNLGDGTSETPRYKNQWLQFTVGYRF